jgi:hypothetical protein
MAKTTNPAWSFVGSQQACREVAFSGRLATLANEAAAEGFPFTAEHLRHLAFYVLDEAALRHSDLQLDSEDEGPGPA